MHKFIQIHPDDTVAVALVPLEKGTVLSLPGSTITLSETIPQGHKFALCDIPNAAPILKYGSSIGTATTWIPAGSLVHTHNCRTALGGSGTYIYQPAPDVPKNSLSNLESCSTKERFFQGYRRENGKAGIRNEIWIIPTVGCVNSVALAIERQSQIYKTGSIDSIHAFTHPYGCSQLGDDQEHTRQILADLVNHPNAGGVLVLGLGCENSNITELKKYIGAYDPRRVKFLNAQDSQDEIADALTLIQELCCYTSSFTREKISVSELIVGLKCGGSDGLSGITANPTVGAFSDLLIQNGGTTILTEVPEMFGAETQLMNRCQNEALFQQTVSLITNFKEYFTSHGQPVYENPSPGNKAGGISTLEDKSLGCTQKSGSAPVTGVLSYGDVIHNKGLNLLSAPGNDLVAATALAASGAQLILFTTGRGTPFASPVPTLKLSSNNALSAHKKSWIDFNCGVLADDVPLPELALELYHTVLSTASGKRTCTEELGYHDMAIFKQGVTL